MANKKEKKISINAFEKVMKEMYTEDSVVIDWRGIEVKVKRTLGANEVVSFTTGVVNSCFGSDLSYNPEAKEIAFKTNILTKYANFTMPADIELQYKLLYCTDAVHAVMEHINMEQLDEIRNAISERIQYRIRANVETVNRQVTDLFAAIDNMQHQLSTMFSGISDGDITKLTEALSGGIDEEKLVKAYMDHTNTSNEEDDGK